MQVKSRNFFQNRFSQNRMLLYHHAVSRTQKCIFWVKSNVDRSRINGTQTCLLKSSTLCSQVGNTQDYACVLKVSPIDHFGYRKFWPFCISMQSWCLTYFQSIFLTLPHLLFWTNKKKTGIKLCLCALKDTLVFFPGKHWFAQISFDMKKCNYHYFILQGLCVQKIFNILGVLSNCVAKN